MFEAGGFVFTIMHDQSMRQMGLHSRWPEMWSEPWDAFTVVTVFTSRENAKESIKAIAVGVAYCSRKDIFNKKIGRKVALADALSQLKLSRDQRKHIWEEYFKLFRR